MRSLEPMLYGVTPESNSVSLSFGPIWGSKLQTPTSDGHVGGADLQQQQEAKQAKQAQHAQERRRWLAHKHKSTGTHVPAIGGDLHRHHTRGSSRRWRHAA